MNFDEAKEIYTSAYWEIKKMNVESINLFSETHGLDTHIQVIADLKAAQKYICYKYLAKICALNAINMPEKWFKKLKDAELLYIGSTNDSIKLKDPKKRGARAVLITKMLVGGASREEIKLEVAEQFPNTPLSNIGCQIAATICHLKRKETKDVVSNQKV